MYLQHFYLFEQDLLLLNKCKSVAVQIVFANSNLQKFHFYSRVHEFYYKSNLHYLASELLAANACSSCFKISRRDLDSLSGTLYLNELGPVILYSLCLQVVMSLIR